MHDFTHPPPSHVVQKVGDGDGIEVFAERSFASFFFTRKVTLKGYLYQSRGAEKEEAEISHFLYLPGCLVCQASSLPWDEGVSA